eukprot:scaffold15521_cov119-Cylindrotheca_fusiformis.AAC.3
MLVIPVGRSRASTILSGSSHGSTLGSAFANGARGFASKRTPEHSTESAKNRLDKERKAKQKLEAGSKTPSQPTKPRTNRFKSSKVKDLKQGGNTSKPIPRPPPVIQASSFVYDDLRRARTALNAQDIGSASPRVALSSLDASSVLDPLSYCKTTAKTAQTHGVNRSISGTDAARRLLRGKKEFITTARRLRAPTLLVGHGVPAALFQHCIDMADALMLQCGPDVVECTFHNYNHQGNDSILPQVLRIRGRDATNQCSRWPPRDRSSTDWNHHMSLYLTVMERLSKNLGLVMKKTPPSIQDNEEDEGDNNHNDVVSSPLLFANSNQIPHWNVDILRGSYFDLHHADGRSDSIPPMPIVEFSHVQNDSETIGHVLIRLQGRALPNDGFHVEHSRKPVTLVFDACFQSENGASRQ